MFIRFPKSVVPPTLLVDVVKEDCSFFPHSVVFLPDSKAEAKGNEENVDMGAILKLSRLRLKCFNK